MANPAHQHSTLADGSVVPFVILQHTDRFGHHYDLMIEEGPHLATWKFSHPPGTTEGPILGDRIFNHRPAFLDYEGPLSGDKGHVNRVDAGSCVIHEKSAEVWKMTFRGQRLVGGYALKADATRDQGWWFQALRS